MEINQLLEKFDALKKLLKQYESVAVAFSSGVDSTFLLYAAKEALGGHAIAVTAASLSFPKRELEEAKEYCKTLGVRQEIIKTNELEIEGFAENPKDKCYLCKKEFFTRIIQCAKENGIAIVVEGSNLDDDGDYRPGHRAIKELGVKSPLRECGFSKQDIRDLSEYLNIPTWDKPSFACLSSRIPYGERITKQKLEMIDRAEQYLLELGFKQFRVRVHGNLARIEVLPNEIDKLMQENMRKNVSETFKSIGFLYVTVDMMGYRTGSLNEALGVEKA